MLAYQGGVHTCVRIVIILLCVENVLCRIRRFFFCYAKFDVVAACPFFLFILCFAATQLALQLHQECTQVVCSNKVAWKRRGLTRTASEGTPAMDLGHMNVVLKWMYLYVESLFRVWNLVLN